MTNRKKERSTFRLSSSFRTVPPEETLARVREFAPKLGISRVTDITRLDRIGMPVFTSIRPAALRGSLCCNAGKGVSKIEAEVGAYMEAIEFAFAEYGRSQVKSILATPRDVLDGYLRPEAILDLCPKRGIQIDINGPIECVESEELISRNKCLIPSELVFMPYNPTLGGPRYFGSNSNGLSSGNDIFEATVHGLAEVVERDIETFNMAEDQSVLVQSETLPDPIRMIKEQIEAAGLKLYVRYIKNIFQLPYFNAGIAEIDSTEPTYVNGGHGCHPSRSVALARAVCEALQSRLIFIHGGRDDLIDFYTRYESMSFDERALRAKLMINAAARENSVILYDDIPDPMPANGGINTCFDILTSSLRNNGLTKICRVVLTEPTDPVQVTRIIVPGLEFFNDVTQRVGPRLRDYVKARA